MRAYTLFLVFGLVLLFFSPALLSAASGEEDSDGDGYLDYEDNCPYDYNKDQTDSDYDGIGDACDSCDNNDPDGDGVPNCEDECPYEAGSSKNYGCPEEEPDYDGDGIPDSQDNCPEVYNKDQTDTDYDGLGDACDQCDDNDADGDGVVNCEDECPYEYGTSKNHGCPEQGEADSDQDGVIDSIDNCVLIYNPDQGDQDGDGEGNACDKCDDRDSDKDGIVNCEDSCPNDKGTSANYGCPEQQQITDIDGDGVPDSSDNCPKEFGTVKNKGCPEQAPTTPTPSISLVNIDITRLLDLSGGNRGRVQVMVSQPPPGAGIGLIQLFVDNIPRGSCIMTRNCTVNVPELHPGSQLGASVLLTNFTVINVGTIPIGFLLNSSQTQDTDRDGVANAFDNCVNISNADQADDDHDNVGDVCDSCNVRRATSRMAFFTIISCAGDPTVSFLRNGRYYWQDLYDRINTNNGCGCKDSDGTNYFFRGAVSTESVNTAPAAIDPVSGTAGYQATSSCNQADQDTCLDGTRLAETICTASGPARTTITCPAGCSNGVCSCPDTDGGLIYITRGTLLNNTDFCTGDSLTEYYCGMDSAGRLVALNRTIECPLGCSQGACLCSETDSGFDADHKGFAGTRYVDNCSTDRVTLTEYQVHRNATQCSLLTYTWRCEGSCQNGECEPPTCFDQVQNQGETGVDCGGPCSACGYFMIRGNLKYEKGNPYDNGNTQLIGYRPVRETLVFAIVQSDDEDIRNGYGGYGLLDSRGYFTIIVPRRAGVVYRLQVSPSNMAANIGKDYHSCDEYVYFNAQRTFTVPAAGNIDLGNMTFYKDREPDFNAYWTEEDSIGCGDSGDINGGAQYFSIADTLLLAKQYVDANRDDTDALGRVNIAYPETVSSSGAAMHSSGEISIPGPNSFYYNSDPGYRDKTVLHEYGHNIEYRISTSDCYIGDSDHSFCSQNDEEFAWSEGFAEYFAQFMMNKYRFDPLHNLSMVGENGYGIENPTCSGGLNSMIEGGVQAVLWDLADVVGPTYPAANITEASFDRVANKDRVIMRILDKELDYCCDAPDICDFVRGSNGWKNRGSEVGNVNDINDILTQYGMSGVTGSSGGC